MPRWLLIALAVIPCPTARGDAPAAVTVHVPYGATLTIDGRSTQQFTAVRQFVSPPLPVGKVFVYTFRATYTWFGVPTTKERAIDVSAGERYELELSGAADVPATMPQAEPLVVPPMVPMVAPVVEPPPRAVEPPPPVEPPPAPMPRKVVEEPPLPTREPAPSPRPIPEPDQLPILPEPRPEGVRKPDDQADDDE